GRPHPHNRKPLHAARPPQNVEPPLIPRGAAERCQHAFRRGNVTLFQRRVSLLPPFPFTQGLSTRHFFGAAVFSPGGAADLSPWREPWDRGRRLASPRVLFRPSPARGERTAGSPAGLTHRDAPSILPPLPGLG